MKASKQKSSLGLIWEKWAEDKKEHNTSTAYTNLQQGMARGYDDIVPGQITALELFKQITDAEQYTKADQQSSSGDPVQIMGEWLRGEKDLSRTQMDKIAKQRVQ